MKFEDKALLQRELELRKKYRAIDNLVLGAESGSYYDAIYDGYPTQLVDVMGSNVPYSNVRTSFKEMDLGEQLTDMYDVMKLMPDSMLCQQGYLPSREHCSALILACFNNTFPVIAIHHLVTCIHDRHGKDTLRALCLFYDTEEDIYCDVISDMKSDQHAPFPPSRTRAIADILHSYGISFAK